MFRASDIFGRRPGNNAEKPTVVATAQKRSASDGPSSRTWDPATGKFFEEELPAEVQEMMGIKKKIKAEMKTEQNEKEAWGIRSANMKVANSKILGPAAVGLQPQVKKELGRGGVADAAKIDKTTPSVEYRGFSKVDLNERYYERTAVMVNGRPTYWAGDAQFFLYWQGEVQRWSICDAASFSAVKAGQLPGWAYKEDHRHLCQATGWMEAWNGEWRAPELEVTFRSSSHHKKQWEDPLVQKSITTVDFRGFAMKELNTRYTLRINEVIQGKPSYWDSSGVYFIYWQQQMKRWAICDLKCMEAVRDGQCPGWAYRSDIGHFANACGWMEMRANQWVDAIVETAVIGVSTKGLKVEFSGFAKMDLNTQYTEKADEEVQGRPTFWDSSETYFIYWQSSMKRWAICDKASLHPAQSGLAPGWAYKTDSQHFARSSGWMETWGREWKPAMAVCTLLEGTLRADQESLSLVKKELEAGEETGSKFSANQYKILVQKVYEQKNPDKLPDLPLLLEKYKEREHELFKQVCEKYEVDADEIATECAPMMTEAAPDEEQDGEQDAQKEDGMDEYAHLENAEVPDLNAMEYAILIQNVYERYNPKKLQDMGRLLQKYRNRERQLYHEVCKKYGTHPAKFHARHLKDRAAETA